LASLSIKSEISINNLAIQLLKGLKAAFLFNAARDIKNSMPTANQINGIDAEQHKNGKVSNLKLRHLEFGFIEPKNGYLQYL